MKDIYEIQHDNNYTFSSSYSVAPIIYKELLTILYYIDLIYDGIEVKCLFTNWEYQKFHTIDQYAFIGNVEIMEYFEAFVRIPYFYENEDSLILKDWTEESGLDINGGFGDVNESYSICFNFSGVFYADIDYLWSYKLRTDKVFNNKIGAKLNRSKMRELLQILKIKYDMQCYQLHSDYIPLDYLTDVGIAEGAVTMKYLKFIEREDWFLKIERKIGIELDGSFKEYLKKFSSKEFYNMHLIDKNSKKWKLIRCESYEMILNLITKKIFIESDNVIPFMLTENGKYFCFCFEGRNKGNILVMDLNNFKNCEVLIVADSIQQFEVNSFRY